MEISPHNANYVVRVRINYHFLFCAFPTPSMVHVFSVRCALKLKGGQNDLLFIEKTGMLCAFLHADFLPLCFIFELAIYLRSFLLSATTKNLSFKSLVFRPHLT